MRDDAPTEAQAAERLAHHLLGEAYRDLAAVLLGVDAKAAAGLFHAIEARTADALRAIVAEKSEGTASTRIARSAGKALSDLFEEAHRQTGTSRNGIPASRKVA